MKTYTIPAGDDGSHSVGDNMRLDPATDETETRLIVENVDRPGITSEIRLNVPLEQLEQFVGMGILSVGGSEELTYRILSAETVPVERPETKDSALERVAKQFWDQIKMQLGTHDDVWYAFDEEWSELDQNSRDAIQSALRDALDELEDR